MKKEKTIKMTVDGDLVKRADGKSDLKLEYRLKEGKGRRTVDHGLYTEIISYEQLLEIQKRHKKGAA